MPSPCPAVYTETLIPLPSRTRLGVYVIHSSENPPRLEKVRTITVQKFENFASLGSYIAYGWIDRSHPGPRHLIKIMKFESCYRKLTEYSTVEVIWEIGKHSVSTLMVGITVY